MKVAFHASAWTDYLYWQGANPKLSARLNDIIEDMRRSPFRGLGKPEPLRENLAGWWSRRLNEEHRIIYQVTGTGESQRIEIMQCRYHYDR